MSRVLVLGGGVAGMAAAWSLRQAGPDRRPEVTLVEAGDRLGGKIRTSAFAGVPVDEGPDAFLARVPAGVELCRALGLAGDLVSPSTGRAFLWTGDGLRPFPEGLVLGVPPRLLPLTRSGLLSARGLARAAIEPLLPRRVGRPGPGDVAVGALVAARFGREVCRLLVDPLLGGITAGRSEELSLAVVAPHLAAVAGRHRSLLLGLRAEQGGRGAGRGAGPAGPPSGPVFHTVAGGLGRLVDALTSRLAADGVEVRTGLEATGLERAGAGWVLRTAGGQELAGDGVVVAVPAFAAARILAGASPAAASRLAGIDYASVAVVTLAYPAAAVGRALDGSGFLVPRGDGRLVTACSWASSKWPQLARPDRVVLRASVGRWGDERWVGLDDDELVGRVHAEIGEALALTAAPSAARVSRWPRSLPQYRPGHLHLVTEVEGELARRCPGVALAGAATRGLGIPACVESGQAAAAAVLRAADG